MNLLAVVLIQGIHIQGVEMDIQQALRKPFVAFDDLHDLLVFGAVQAEPNTFLKRNFTDSQRQRHKDRQRSLDSFRYDYVRPFLRDGASLGLTMDNRTRVKPLPFIQWLTANHFQPCQTALTAIEAVASEETKLAPVVDTESPPEPVKSVPEPVTEIGQVKAIVVGEQAPDNRIHSTKDTPKAGSMRLLITDLLLGHPDEKSGLAWARIVKLASSEEGRAEYPFLVGVNATLSEVYYLEGEGKKGIDKEGFVKKFSYIKSEMNR